MGWMGGDSVPSTKHLCQMPFMLERPSFFLFFFLEKLQRPKQFEIC